MRVVEGESRRPGLVEAVMVEKELAAMGPGRGETLMITAVADLALAIQDGEAAVGMARAREGVVTRVVAKEVVARVEVAEAAVGEALERDRSHCAA